ncbi:MAG: rhamnan synthesis F family protein [Actinomyces urogenitalis]|uniref:rhamnan synthesis F family protein n=1 Tax=Actinomyces urogenitalis TaxID=103621 RepID=UPI00050DF809|nr:rhamnan synthesis F family protein [Actinomyces urogenitalis]KGF01257.1 hypothetical protein HMPREF1626_07680 [Actinomyces urogenitalis S6-C4]MDU5875335.1 rhamnan synthesis F family protein [Actinomyces urogenitalis]
MRRIIIYFHFDAVGQVHNYVIRALDSLRPHAAHLLVVSNAPLDVSGTAVLAAHADALIVRPNTDYDVGAYRDAIAHLGSLVAEADELVMTNHTYFAPVRPWGPVFALSESWDDVGVWGLTEHREVRPHPFLAQPVMPQHLSSHWIAVRSRFLHSQDFTAYWEAVPPIRSYRDSIQWHESRFTAYAQAHGYRTRAVFPAADYEVDNAAVEDAGALLADGCPILKRRALFHDPLHQERGGQRLSEVMESVAAGGYDTALILDSLVRTVPQRDLVANLGLTHVAVPTSPPVSLPSGLVLLEAGTPETTVDTATVGSVEPWPVVRVHAGQGRQMAVDSVKHTRPAPLAHRGVVSCLLGAREDLAALPRGALVLVLPSAALAEEGGSRSLRRAMDCVVDAPGALGANVALFAEHPGLGCVLPATDHAGTGLLGHGWAGSREEMLRWARDAGITVPLDPDTPLAPFDGVVLLSADAVRGSEEILSRLDSLAGDRADLLLTAALATHGWHTRQVLGGGWAAADYSLLEYKYDRLAAFLPARADEQVPYLRARTHGVKGLGEMVRRELEQRSPGLALSLKPVYRRIVGGFTHR